MMRFKALEDFRCEDLKSGYCRGLIYHVLPGNVVLAAFVPHWEAEGKVKILHDSVPQSRLTGKGTLS